MRPPDALSAGSVAAAYVRANFAASDRLALVLLKKSEHSVVQRLASAAQIASPEVQAWLRAKNAAGFDVYVSMNALRPAAMGRTKQDVETIRHIYLDLDLNGTETVAALLARADLPRPNFLIDSSPGKWQVVWKTEGFGKEDAEELQKTLARDCGGDPAATDCARVLRIPDFYNHKYLEPYLIGVKSLTREIYRPDHFPKPTLAPADRSTEPAHHAIGRGRVPRPLSQSEHDWAYAKRALSRGESPALVAAEIATYRRFDKQNPHYYAELTVRKAARSLQPGSPTGPSEEPERR